MKLFTHVIVNFYHIVIIIVCLCYFERKSASEQKSKKKTGNKRLFSNSQQEVKKNAFIQMRKLGRDGKKVLAISAIIENILLPAVYLLTTAFIL